MKNLFWSFIVLGGFILLGTNVIQATETEPAKKKNTQTIRPGFTDTNSDGVCEYYDGKQPGKGLGPGNGEGMGKATGKGLGKGAAGLKVGSGNGQRRLDGSGNGCSKGNGKQLRNGSGGNCSTPSKL